MADKNLYRVVDGVTALTGSLTITLPIDLTKQVEKARMSDGSFRLAFFQDHRKWKLNFPALVDADLAQLITLVGWDEILRWNNLDEEDHVYEVVITDFSYDSINPIPIGADVLDVKIYKASMVLEEAI